MIVLNPFWIPYAILVSKHRSDTWNPKGMFSAPPGHSVLCFNPNRNGSNSRIVLQTPEFASELVNPVKLSDKSIEGRSLNSEIVLKIGKLVHNYLICDFF